MCQKPEIAVTAAASRPVIAKAQPEAIQYSCMDLDCFTLRVRNDGAGDGFALLTHPLPGGERQWPDAKDNRPQLTPAGRNVISYFIK
jgi:hypothetical protein